MLEGIRDKVKEQMELQEQKRILRKKAKLEKELKKANEEKEKLRLEQEKIQAERDRLSNLSEKELMAEAIMALRGFYSQFEELQKEQEEIHYRVCELEDDIIAIRSALEAQRNDDI